MAVSTPTHRMFKVVGSQESSPVAAGVLDHLLGGLFRCLWLLRHLDLLIDKMNQKSSVIQILKSVPRVLTSDRGLLSLILYSKVSAPNFWRKPDATKPNLGSLTSHSRLRVSLII